MGTELINIMKNYCIKHNLRNLGPYRTAANKPDSPYMQTNAPTGRAASHARGDFVCNTAFFGYEIYLKYAIMDNVSQTYRCPEMAACF